MGLLTIVFVVLKLIGKIHWSWFWVLSPVWILSGIVVLLIIPLAVICWLSAKKEAKRWTK